MMRLGRCEDCGAIQYPHRARCMRCLGDTVNLQWRAAPGRVLATTNIHRGIDPRFAPDTPQAMGSVRLDAGPIVLALLTPGCAPGTTVGIDETTVADRTVLSARRESRGG